MGHDVPFTESVGRDQPESDGLVEGEIPPSQRQVSQPPLHDIPCLWLEGTRDGETHGLDAS